MTEQNTHLETEGSLDNDGPDDLSSQDRAGSILDVIRGCNIEITDAVASAILGLGVMAHVNNLTNSIPALEGISGMHLGNFVLRFGLGVTAATAGYKLAKRFPKYSGEESLLKLLKEDTSKGLKIAALVALETMAIFYSVDQGVVGLRNDFVQNATVSLNVLDAIEDPLNEEYGDDKYYLPPVANQERMFLQEVIGLMDADGSFTPEALAKLAIYFDGWSFIPNSSLLAEGEPMRSGRGDFWWKFGLDGAEYEEQNEETQDVEDKGYWRIVCLNGKDWELKSTNGAGWVMQRGTDSTTIIDNFDALCAEDSMCVADLSPTIHGSGLIDGESILEQIVPNIELPETTNEIKELEDEIWKLALLPVVPSELSKHWSEDIGGRLEGEKQAWWASVDASFNELFNAAYTAEVNDTSHAEVIAFIDDYAAKNNINQ